jgi:hypothetical protein
VGVFEHLPGVADSSTHASRHHTTEEQVRGTVAALRPGADVGHAGASSPNAQSNGASSTVVTVRACGTA